MPPARRPLVALAGALALAVGGCGGGGRETSRHAGSERPRHGTAPAGFDATLQAPGHRPRAARPWPIVVTAHDRAGHPLPAVVTYQFLFAGRVVAHRSRYRFRGRFRDVVTWPRRSVGVPLTFRALVRTRLGVRALDYPVVVTP